MSTVTTGSRVEGADALAAALERFPKASKKELRRSNADVARVGRGWAREAARGSRLTSRMAMGIGSGANSTSAYITVKNTISAPGATVAFYGVKRRLGWYAHPRYDASPPQFAGYDWIGTNWKVGVRGQGPYEINTMLADKLPVLRRLYFARQVEVVERLMREAQT